MERALASADVVFEEEFYIQRHSGVPLETRGSSRNMTKASPC